jgi:hypothetical protein
MDSVRDLLSIFLKIAFALFVIVLVLMFTSLVPRGVKSDTASASSTSIVDLLPSPRKYSGFFSSSTTKNNIAQAPLFSAADTFSYNGPIAFASTSIQTATFGTANNNNQYITYTGGGSAQVSNVTALQQTSTATRNLNVRNLSIYEGGSVYTGLSFIGEAKSSMFRDGKFPIIIIDGAGRLVGVSAAVAQTAWAVPGWVRFETRINYTLPNKAPCTMIFEEALTQTERVRQPLRVPLQVRCN